MRWLSFLCISVTAMWPDAASAQYYFYNGKYYDQAMIWEVGGSLGAMNCLTDLGGRKGPGKKFLKDLNPGNTKLCGALYSSALYKQTVGCRFEITLGSLTASDDILSRDQSVARNRYRRNLNFRTALREFVVISEFYALTLLRNREKALPTFSPYILAGIGFFHFNPQAKDHTGWVFLHPLHTEGEGLKEFPHRPAYKLIQLNFPIGVGVKYEVAALWTLRFEIIHRNLQTDYLDDVSTSYIDPLIFYRNLESNQAVTAHMLADRRGEIDPLIIPAPGDIRGNPRNNDAYFSFNLKIGRILNRQPRK